MFLEDTPGETSMSGEISFIAGLQSSLSAGVQALGKRLFRNDIERPAGVSGTGPTVAEEDCQKEEKDQVESQHARVEPVHLRTCWNLEV